MVMLQPFVSEVRDRRKLHQQPSSTNYIDQLDLAARTYENKRMTVQNPEFARGPVAPQPQSTTPIEKPIR